ncbi:hypothetical protein RBA00_13230, partial [Mycobacteroides abscessus subsp. massiliense]
GIPVTRSLVADGKYSVRDRWEEFDGTLLEFLVAIFSKSYVCPIFPDDFPAQDGSYFTPSA